MMTIHIPALSGMILVYLLVFARVGSMLMLLPGIGDVGIPSRVRLVLALSIAFAFAPVAAQNYSATEPTSALQLGLLIAQEVTAGVLVGSMARIIMSSLQVAGYLIATQTGLAYAQTIDPTQGQQGAIVGTFFSMLGTTLIFATDLHHLAIGAIAGSYHLIPPGGTLPTADMAELTIRLVSGSFALGFQLAAPFLVFSFAVTAAIGLLARLMPQLQVFFLAMPVNILAGFLILMLLLGSMMTMFLNYFGTSMGTFL
jgi:flagellar biosynthetic protein FliR